MSNWFITIHFLGAVQCVFLATILFNKKGDRSVATRVLGTAILVFGIDLFTAVYHGSGYDRQFPDLIGIDAPFGFLYGPLFYLYVRALSNREMRLHVKDLWHLAPFLVYGLILIPFYAQSGAEKLQFLYESTPSRWPLVFKISTVFKVLHGVLYVGAMFTELRRLRLKIRETHSSIERINMLWLRNIVFGIVGLICISAIMSYLHAGQESARMLGLDPTVPYDDYSLFGVSLFIYALGYLGLRQPEIFDNRWESYVSTLDNKPDESPAAKEVRAAQEKEAGETEKPRYSRSGMTEEAASVYRHQLVDLMKVDKPYLSGDLTLLDLSEKLSLSPHNLTEVINTQFNQNFYEFVNSYRIEEVKARLSDSAYSHMTLLAIGLDSGFNSKSSFNAVFKKQVGMTPSQFKKQLTV